MELTWDETDPNRGKAMKRAFEVTLTCVVSMSVDNLAPQVEGDEMEEVAKDLIAPPSDEEDSDEENTEQDGAGDGGGVERDSISKFRCGILKPIPCLRILSGVFWRTFKTKRQGAKSVRVIWK